MGEGWGTKLILNSGSDSDVVRISGSYNKLLNMYIDADGGNQAYGGNVGLWWAKKCVVSGLYVYRPYYECIYLYPAFECFVLNNYCDVYSGSGNGKVGILVYGFPDTATSGSIISGNIVVHAAKQGISVSGSVSGSIISNNLVQYNDEGIRCEDSVGYNLITGNLMFNNNTNLISGSGPGNVFEANLY